MNADYNTIIDKAYNGFNTRDTDAVLQLMATNVKWPKAFEGGYVTGHEAIRDYWARQWSEINPQVTPVAITKRPDGRVEVTVHQLVKSPDGTVLFDGNVKHIYSFDNAGMITVMDVETE